jgi:predicted Zn-dependent peptidase
MSVQTSTLKNGVTIIIDPMPDRSIAALAISLAGGSADEKYPGSTHLLEHLLFRKTQNRNSLQIASTLDELGGGVNAFTDPESLCLHGTVPSEMLSELIELFTDLLLAPRFEEKDVALEKEIVRQEILESEDDPHSTSFEKFHGGFWNHQPLSKLVAGTLDSVSRLTLSQLLERKNELLQGKKMTIALSGGGNLDAACELLSKLFEDLPAGESWKLEVAAPISGFEVFPRNIQQVLFYAGIKSSGLLSPQALPTLVGSAILGSGNASRMFQVLREERGLCYDVGVSLESYPQLGALIFSGSTEVRHLDTLFSLYQEECTRMHEGKFTDEEFKRAKRMLRSQLIAEEESITSHLWRALDSILSFGRYVSTEETRKKLDLVKREDVEQAFHFSAGSHFILLSGELEHYNPGEAVRYLSRS